MRILLTGVAGFIGSHLAARLQSRGDSIYGIDNFDETLYPKALHQRNLQTLDGLAGIESAPIDFLDGEAIEQLFSTRRFDIVVHLGALAGVRPSIQQPMRYARVNIEGTLVLLEACRRHRIGRFVFASSSSVYGAHCRVPFAESDPAARPASPYAASKRAGELVVSNFSDLYGIACTSLRFFTVYGPRQRPEMAIHKFADLILAKQPLPFFGDGSSARDYTYVTDIIDGVTAAIDHTVDKRYRVYNLGGHQTTTLSRLVALLEANLPYRAILNSQPDQPGDVPITYADVTQATADLGYAPKVPIETGIKLFCQWLLRERGLNI